MDESWQLENLDDHHHHSRQSGGCPHYLQDQSRNGDGGSTN